MSPRILLVMPEQWPRALLRAELIERGYDAVGAVDLLDALAYRSEEEERGPVRVIVMDEAAVVGPATGTLQLLLRKQGNPEVLLLHSPSLETPSGRWTEVIERPVTIGEIAAAVGRWVAP